MPENRPHSREKAPSSGTGHVEKRGSGTGYGRVGNSGAPHGAGSVPGSGQGMQGLGGGMQGPRPSMGRRAAGGGSGLVILIAVVFFLLRSCGIFSNDYSYSDQSESSQADQSYSQTQDSSYGGFGGISGSTWSAQSLSSSGNGWFSGNTTSYEDATMKDVDKTVDPLARDKFTKIKGNGADTVTVMVYMCGSDLESKGGMATADINEMAYATLSDKVNVILETGGCRKWRNSVISSKTNQRYRVKNKGLEVLDPDVGKKRMTDPDTLLDFINFASSSYPADRYILILWDHGGGSVSGYGYDENYPNGTMTIDQIADVLKKSGIKYDIVGFDACLMAGMETAIAVEPYADYLIASEESEPGTGWYYTGWLTKLSPDTSIETVDLARILIDDFTSATVSSQPKYKTTLSIIDLAEFKGVIPKALTAFGDDLSKKLKSRNYKEVAKARSSSREFASSSHIDQIDLVNFCRNINSKESNALADEVQKCVKYNKIYNITNAYGMSVYFPYSSLKSVNSMAKIYDNLDIDDSYADSVKSFAALESSGQIVSSQMSGNTSLFDVLLSGGSSSAPASSYTGSSQSSVLESILMSALKPASSSVTGASSYSGSASGYGSLPDYTSLLGGSGIVDSSSVQDMASLLGMRDIISSEDLEISRVNGRDVISLSEEQWSDMKNVALNVFVDDGEGFIDLGLDNIASYDEDGNLIVDYDGDWIALNGYFAAFYISQDDYDEESGYYRTQGYIPAELNGEYVNIIVEFSNDSPAGEILGAQQIYEEGESVNITNGKGLIDIEEGDRIDFLCDYYAYDGSFIDSYHLNNSSLTVRSDGLRLETLTMDNENAYYSYRLTDYYNSNYWTPVRGLGR